MQDLNHVGGHRSDPAYDAPEVLERALKRRILPLVNRPGRYLGGELGAVRAPWSDARANLLLAFPDAYEVGVSNNGLRQLYAALNRHPDTFADLCFAPWPDMEERLRAERAPLWGLQSRRPAAAFDVLGFSVGYELCYTNLLTMIDLAGVPLLAAERGDGDPVVIAGGHGAVNPMVLGPFVDLFAVGDGEEIVLEIADAVNAWKRDGGGRDDLLARLRALEGLWWEGKETVTRGRVVDDLNRFPPLKTLVPVIEAVHDRLSLEVMRGCARGCRFCQAGMITRPVRERDVAQVIETSLDGARGLGWKEISLLSLSTCDYTGLGPAMRGIADEIRDTHTRLELPSLRVDALDESVYDLLGRERPGSFTFAPEAGSQRLRDVINKNITDEDVLLSVKRAFASGAKKVKLYFMIGLPTETDEDLDALVALVRRVVGAAPRGGSQVTVSISPFSPKAHTPFQWAGQIYTEEIERRNRYLLKALSRTKAKVSLRDPRVSTLEGLLGLGDRALAGVVLNAWRAGARFDGWDERFDWSLWERALADAGVEPARYLEPRDTKDPLPWDGVFAQVSRDFLADDWEKALRGETVPDCRLEGGCERCDACGPELQHVFAERPDGTRARRGAAAVESSGTAAADGAETVEADAWGFDPRNEWPPGSGEEAPVWQRWRNRAAEKCWYRVNYAKTGDAAFLGHLDFQRQLQLALRRSGLPVAYSQGFHPHPLLKFGPPLPVGVAGESELLDIAFDRRLFDWERRLNAQLPPGVKVHASECVGPAATEAIDRSVDRTDYVVILPHESAGGPEAAVVEPLVNAFLDQEHVVHLRRRPKGDVEVDVRPLVCAGGLRVGPPAGPASGPTLDVSLEWRADRPGLPIHEFLAALFGEALPEPRFCDVRRTALLMRNDEGEWVSPLEGIRHLNQRLWLRKHLSA